MYTNALLYLVVFLKKWAHIKNDIPYEKNKKGLTINGNKPAKEQRVLKQIGVKQGLGVHCCAVSEKLC